MRTLWSLPPQTGMLWYRGGLYKFGQLLALLAPCLAWGTVAVLVTVNGVRANQAADATNQACRALFEGGGGIGCI